MLLTLPPPAARQMRAIAAVQLAFSIAACGKAPIPRAERPARGDDVLLAADFSSPSLDGWTFDRARVWSARGGRLRARLPDAKQEKSFAYFGSESWRNYAVDLDLCALRGVDKGVAVRVQGEEGVGVDLRGRGYNDVLMYRGYRRLGRATARNRGGQWHHLRVEVRGGRYRVYVNGRLKIDYLDESDQRPGGRLALAAYTGGAGECEVLYDNVVVRALR